VGKGYNYPMHKEEGVRDLKNKIMGSLTMEIITEPLIKKD